MAPTTRKPGADTNLRRRGYDRALRITGVLGALVAVALGFALFINWNGDLPTSSEQIVRGEPAGAGPPAVPETGSADMASSAPAREQETEGEAVGEIAGAPAVTAAPAPEVAASLPEPPPQETQQRTAATADVPLPAPAAAPAPTPTTSAESAARDEPTQMDTAALDAAPAEAASGSDAPTKPTSDGPAEGDWCASLGVLVETAEDCQSYEAIIEQLQVGGLAYSKPESAYLGHAEEVTLAIDLRGAEQAAEIVAIGPDDVVQAEIPVARIMSAELRGPSFDISPSGPLQKTLTGAAPVVWTWKATPQEAGPNKLLLLDVYVHVMRAGNVGEPITIRTYRDEITVDVQLKDQIVGALTSTQGMVVSIVAILGGLSTIFGWKRWKKGEKD